MADFRNLMVWKKSRILVVRIYQLTQKFPQSELFGLTNQMRRAAVSISSNISEGYGRQSDTEFLYFLRVAKGSLFEVETQLYIAQDLGYILGSENESAQLLCDEISRMLSGLKQSLMTRENS